MTRTEDFLDGNERARSPQFESVQQQGNRNFQATSVLDNLQPNQNGMGSTDLQRRLVGLAQSTTGSAQSTADKRLWITHAEPSQRAKKAQEG